MPFVHTCRTTHYTKTGILLRLDYAFIDGAESSKVVLLLQEKIDYEGQQERKQTEVSFAGDDLVKARNINVDTQNKNVVLKGTVSSEAEKKRAIQIAQAVEEVRSVRSDLSIQ